MNDPACIEKAAEFEPPAIATDKGMVSIVLLDVSCAVTPPAGAFLFNVKVQLPVAFGPRVEALQDSDEIAVGESNEIVAVAELPL